MQRIIYTAPDEKSALAQLDHVTDKWSPQYPYAMKRWSDNWDAISPIFKFSRDVRTAFYTTNVIESLNFNAAAAEPSEERISKVSGAAKVDVSRNIRSHT